MFYRKMCCLCLIATGVLQWDVLSPDTIVGVFYKEMYCLYLCAEHPWCWPYTTMLDTPGADHKLLCCTPLVLAIYHHAGHPWCWPYTTMHDTPGAGYTPPCWTPWCWQYTTMLDTPGAGNTPLCWTPLVLAIVYCLHDHYAGHPWCWPYTTACMPILWYKVNKEQ